MAGVSTDKGKIEYIAYNFNLIQAVINNDQTDIDLEDSV